MNKPTDRNHLIELFHKTLEAPKMSFPIESERLRISGEETSRLNEQLTHAFMIPDHHTFVMDGQIGH